MDCTLLSVALREAYEGARSWHPSGSLLLQPNLEKGALKLSRSFSCMKVADCGVSFPSDLPP